MEFQPERLYTLCLDFIASNLKATIARPVDDSGNIELVVPYLSTELAQDILSAYIDDGHSLTDEVLHMFKDNQRVSLRSVDLRHSRVSNTALGWLSQHTLESIDISGCDKLSYLLVLDCIQCLAPTLQQLKLGDRANVIFQLRPYKHFQLATGECEGIYGATDVLEKLAQASQLAALSLHNLSDPVYAPVLSRFLGSLKSLQHLDLTGCWSVAGSRQDLKPLEILKELPYLSSLILHAVFNPMINLSACLPVLIQLKSLKHLDVSAQLPQRNRHHYSLIPGDILQDGLRQLISNLPLLCSLDISGTSLAGLPIDDNKTYIPIPGLEGRHFDFLGLYLCEHQADHRPDLPADKVTGRGDLNRITEALKTYQHRRDYMVSALRHLYTIVRARQEEGKDPVFLLELVCQLMRLNLPDKDIQRLGSIMSQMFSNSAGRARLRNLMPSKVVKKVVSTLMNCMMKNMRDSEMQHIGLTSFYYLNLPEDVWFHYKAVVSIILRTIDFSIISYHRYVALLVLRQMLRPVNGQEKVIAGDCGLVEAMLRLIESKQEEDKPDRLLILGWNNLVSATDETAVNAVRVTEGWSDSAHNGLTLFMACYEKFFLTQEYTDIKSDLLWGMTGVMANVSDVAELRPILSQHPYLNVFRVLLQPTPIGIDVGFLAASTLCNILSEITDLSSQSDSLGVSANQDEQSSTLLDQPAEAYFHMARIDPVDENAAVEQQSKTPPKEHEIAREEILADLVCALKGWKKDTKRNLRYTSLCPVLKLLQCKHTVEIRHWACFELHNLTTVDPERYCPMLKDEGGIEILENIISTPEDQNGDVMALAQNTLANFSDFQERKTG